MPRLCPIDPNLDCLMAANDYVISRTVALAGGLTPRAITYRLSCSDWQQLLPGVYLAGKGEPTRRQMLIAAQVYAGPHSAIDAVDACRWHGLQSMSVDPDLVHVVAPWEDGRNDAGFVVLRRTVAPIRMVSSDRLRYVDPATAVIAATRGMKNERSVMAALSEAVQRRLATYDDLVRANIQGPPKGARAADRALAYIAAGAHSVREADFLKLVEASPILPKPVCNALLRLRCGRLISPDAWFVEEAVIHETNGRKAHEREDLFEDMQERHDAITDSEFVAFHSSPRRLDQRPRVVIAQLERAVERRRGFGLPQGVEIVSMGD
jgi:hypothetical protein